MQLKKILKDQLFCDGDWVESKDQDPTGDIRLIQLADIGDGQFLNKSNRFMNKPTAERLRCTYLQKDDILIARMPDPLGRACLFPFDEKEKYATVVDVAILRPNGSCDKKYLQYSLNSPFIRHEISRQSTGTTRKRITRKKLGNLEIPLPPLKSQQKIVAILDEADRLRQLDKQLIEKYERLSQSLFLEMFGDPVSNPKGWEKKKLGELCNISSGSTPSRKNEKYFKGNIPWIKTSEVNFKIIIDTNEKITQDAIDNSSCRIYPKGSIVIAMYGQGKTRGRVGILGLDATTNQACAILLPSSKMNYTYLFQLLKFSYQNLRELGRGGNQPNLNTKLVKSYSVINPPMDSQKIFEGKIQNIEQQKILMQEALHHSEELFNSLLQRAFKGGLV